MISVLKYLGSIYADFIRVAELRYKTGDIAKLDVSIAKAKRAEINLLYQQNRIYEKNTYESLKALMQIKEDFTIMTKADYTPLLLTAIIGSVAVNDHPVVQQLYQEAKISGQVGCRISLLGIIMYRLWGCIPRNEWRATMGEANGSVTSM